MKIALGLVVGLLLVSAPVRAQSIGGTLTGPTRPAMLPWTPPARPGAIDVSGTDASYLPSTFLSFDNAVAAGRGELQQDAKTIAEAAAESRRTPKTAVIVIAQDSRGNAVISKRVSATEN
jgi:hypothetical protein